MFPWWLSSKEYSSARDTGSIPGSGGSPGGGHGSPLLGIPWTEEPGRLWSMGSQRAGCDLGDRAQSKHRTGIRPFEKI